MYGTTDRPLQQIPSDAVQPDHYHAFDRVPKKPAFVLITIQKDIEKQRKRMHVSEHPFGTVKHYDGASWFLCRGKAKVTAEVCLAFLSYNIRRAISLCGDVEKLMQKFKGIRASFFKENGNLIGNPA